MRKTALVAVLLASTAALVAVLLASTAALVAVLLASTAALVAVPTSYAARVHATFIYVNSKYQRIFVNQISVTHHLIKYIRKYEWC